MNNADIQVLRAIQSGPYGTAVNKLAEILESLGQTVDGLLEQVAPLKAKADRTERTVETLIEESLPKVNQDFLPEGEEHYHTGDSQACYGADCMAIVPSAEQPEAVSDRG